MKATKASCPIKEYQKFSYELKLKVIDEIQNGQISVNFASKKYNISRSSITYWLKKFSTLDQKKKNMSKDHQIKKLKEQIEELVFVKEFQQEIIADFEVTTGLDLAKKSLPETLAKEIEKKKRNLSKRNG
jgi:transposase-like protein